ncbi:hypothetical protein HCN44_002363 [Aphidius gifuensis]|uniref:Uncharacterized protein n=1 Tax=Aphidius gifuensis TaxID=684658 RepID=A0A834Y2Z3_APHGI|nr:hypothetical protein HCN44_002363 [Aphidius gifuensis]
MGNIMAKVFHNLREIIDEIFFTNSIEIESSNGPTIQEILNTKINKKSSSMSIFYLNEGHHYLKTSNKNDLLKAIENYTKSIIYAKPDSQESQHAYAARSVALFNIRLISESLKDINNISLNNYPNYLKSELFYGKAMCCQILYPNNYKLINDAFDESEKWIKYMKQNHHEKMFNKIIKQKNAELIDRRQFEDKKKFKISSKLKCKINDLPYYSDNIEINYSRSFDIDIDKLDPDKFTSVFILSSYFDDAGKYSKFSDVTKQMASLLTTTTNLLERSEDENVENSMTFDEKYIFLIELLHICLRISECSSVSIGNVDDKLSMIVPAINLTSSNLQENNDKIRKIGIMTSVAIKEGQKIKTSEHCLAKIW